MPLRLRATQTSPKVHSDSYASSIRDANFLAKLNRFLKDLEFCRHGSLEFRFCGLIERLLRILFERMIVTKGERYCAACVTERIRQAMIECGVELVSCVK